MRRLLVFALLTCICAPTFSQHSETIMARRRKVTAAANVVSPSAVTCHSATAVTNTITCTTGNAPSNGTALSDVQWFGTETVASVTTSSGTFVPILTATAWYGPSLGNDYRGFVTGATPGTGLQVTFNFSSTVATAFPEMNTDFSQGTVTAPALDGTAVAAATGSSATSISGNITTTKANEFLWAFCGGSGTVTAGTTPQVMTQSTPAGADSTIIMYGTVVTPGSTNTAQCTQSGTGFYIIGAYPMI